MSLLRLRIYLLFIAAGVIALVATSVAFQSEISSRHRQQEASFLGVAGRVGAEVAEHIAVSHALLEALEHRLDQAHGRGVPLEELCALELIDRGTAAFERLLVVGVDGGIRCASWEVSYAERASLQQGSYLDAVLEGGATLLSSPSDALEWSAPAFSVNRPLRVDGEIVALGISLLDPQNLAAVEVAIPRGTRIYGVSVSGRAEGFGSATRVATATVPGAVRSGLDDAALYGDECAIFEVGSLAWTCATVGETGLGIAMSAPASTITADARRLRTLWLEAVAAIIIGTVVAALMLDVGVVRRVLRVHRLARLERPSLLDLGSRDEIDGILDWSKTVGAEQARLTTRLRGLTEVSARAQRELLIAVMNGVEARHPFHNGHGQKTRFYARALGERFGLSDDDLDVLGFAAQIHDIGMVGVPDAVNLDPDLLDTAGRDELQLHALRGAELLEHRAELPDEVQMAIRHHHERWDGRGYPDGLHGEAIPLWARIISLADAYAGLTSARLSREALSNAAALAELNDGADTQWDGAMVAEFTAIVGGEQAARPASRSAVIEDQARHAFIEAARAMTTRSEALPQPANSGERAASLDLPQGGEIEPGRTFVDGRYIVRRFLGQGSKKRVFLAHDSLLDRDVAFALIRSDGMAEYDRSRVLLEAQTMARLGARDYIVALYDLGDVEGQVYMVTEYMEGGDCEELLRRTNGLLDLKLALGIARDVCRGLVAAHGEHIVHRDLKPGNVWFTASGQARIGDFGLAVALDRARLTLSRDATQPMGTVLYMPPEQVVGGETTSQSDLYSLGAMLYEFVTGKPPFHDSDPWAVLMQHLQAEPVRPAASGVRCPAELDDLIMRLLEKSPEKRPASASEVLSVIERIIDSLSDDPLSDDSIPTTPASPSTRTGVPVDAGAGD